MSVLTYLCSYSYVLLTLGFTGPNEATGIYLLGVNVVNCTTKIADIEHKSLTESKGAMSRIPQTLVKITPNSIIMSKLSSVLEEIVRNKNAWKNGQLL